ncbi:response regulator [Candidatus Sulfurimonas marisnigri]|uniref:histidine kinase n=1 Tax=Candidatus Sulfurimonas marisnigri TaxID=2740405 RepID=A0A7S7LZB5_9BACT|nr:response regulator [Candidatus Sulfurimonas marisnigri]QOY54226.1 response regulator [Candidatus Sulfurimonas marisnigri]
MEDKITILYVEDEAEARDGLSTFINRFAKELFVATDGQEGLELYKKHNPDLVISDIKMPNMNGIDMAKEIKEICFDQHIIFTTAHSEKDFFMKAIDLQVDGYILKPVDLKLLKYRIESIAKTINLKIKYEKQLKQQVKMASMGDMIGNIAHQWRQPLSAISAAAFAAQMKIELGIFDLESEEGREESQKYFLNQLSDIEKYVSNLNNTINDFRNFFSPNKETTNFKLQKSVDKTMSLLKSTFNANNIELIFDIQDIEITSLENELIQALLNIIKNAKDALVSFQENSKKLLFITIYKENNKAIIDIKDNAGGIPENILDKVFDPYFTTKSESEGTGIGLHMTKSIITKNINGNISVENIEYEYESVSYVGARFRVSLPIEQN